MITYYDILGIKRTANNMEIKNAYRQKCKENHPDINPDKNNKAGQEMMCKINEAYRVLRDPELRQMYDARLIETDHYTTPAEPESKTSPLSVDYLYQYYQAFDYDEDSEKEFIEWLETFSAHYMRAVMAFYKNVVNDEVNNIFNSFADTIELEKKLTKKKELKN